ncbi:MAG: DUF2118 domain-containing protein [Desulfurococcaceae archaeon]
MTEEYIFPETYVEDVEGQKYVCIKNGTLVVNSDVINQEHCIRRFGLIPYEQVVNYLDFTEAKTKRSIVILRKNPWEGAYQGYIFEENTSICLQEITGSAIFILTREGSIIGKDDPVAYVVTNKLEVRNVKSNCEGLVAFIVDLPWEEPRKSILVVSNVYGSIVARESA